MIDLDIKQNTFNKAFAESYLTITEYIKKIHSFGAKKYGVDSWKVDPVNRKSSFSDNLHSMWRHALSIQLRKYNDKESNELHLAHLWCRLHMLVTTYYYALDTDEKAKDAITIKPLGEGSFSTEQTDKPLIPISGEFNYVINDLLGNLSEAKMYLDGCTLEFLLSKIQEEIIRNLSYVIDKDFTVGKFFKESIQGRRGAKPFTTLTLFLYIFSIKSKVITIEEEERVVDIDDVGITVEEVITEE